MRKNGKLGAVAALIVLASFLSARPCAAERLDRYETRSSEMLLPDPVLDPFSEPAVPATAPPGVARIPDSVDEEPFDDQALDSAEQEEYDRYLVEQGAVPDPNDDLGQDRWDGGSGPDSADDAEDSTDPAEW
jgi:hypothetical protein